MLENASDDEGVVDMLRRLTNDVVAISVVLGVGGCATGGGVGACNVEYPKQISSNYVLPWTVGETYRVVNTNCGRGQTHNGLARFAYDFQMPVGTVIRASRAGTVIDVNDQYADYNGTPGEENWIFIRHDDGTVARYYHLTREGGLVEIGSEVASGQAIGFSGATGYIGWRKIPHLHFDVTEQECGTDFFGHLCETVPITFRNTRPHPTGLRDQEDYPALELESE